MKNFYKIFSIAFLISFLFSGNVFSQTRVVINGNYIVQSGGTSGTPSYMIVDNPATNAITRVSGHIVSEGEYNFVKWNMGSLNGSYVYPFGVGAVAADYIPFTFNKTSGDANLAISTYGTPASNLPLSNSVSNMNPSGPTSDANNMVIDRWWKIQIQNGVSAPAGDLTFSYRGSENTVAGISCPGDIIASQYWNGTNWLTPAMNPGSACTTTGIGTALANGVSVFTTTSSQPFGLVKKTNPLGFCTPPTITIDSIYSVSDCNASDGAIFITASGGASPYTYLWMPGGFTTDDISVIAPGSYSVTVTDAVGCDSSISQNIYVAPPPTSLSICLSTVDSIASAFIDVVWEKPVTTAIDSFKIYRKISSLFTPIATIPYSALSMFKDTTNGINPKTTPYFYKISSVDTNGIEGPLSNTHETMWLQVSQSNPPAFDLTWTDYCGFPVTKYYIERDSNNTNYWVTIDSSSWGTNAYVDSFPPTDSAAYRIMADIPTACIVSIKNPLPAAVVKSTRSNTYKTTSLGVYDNLLDKSIIVYPNPSSGKFKIHSSGFKVKNLEVYNLYGEKILSLAGIQNSFIEIDLSVYSNGIYFVKLNSSAGTVVRKVAITH